MTMSILFDVFFLRMQMLMLTILNAVLIMILRMQMGMIMNDLNRKLPSGNLRLLLSMAHL